jgi:hypothetical protein
MYGNLILDDETGHGISEHVGKVYIGSVTIPWGDCIFAQPAHMEIPGCQTNINSDSHETDLWAAREAHWWNAICCYKINDSRNNMNETGGYIRVPNLWFSLWTTNSWGKNYWIVTSLSGIPLGSYSQHYLFPQSWTCGMSVRHPSSLGQCRLLTLLLSLPLSPQ